MISKIDGNETNRLTEFGQAVEELLSIPGLDLSDCLENEHTFFVTISPPAMKARDQILDTLRQHHGIFSIVVNYEIWNGAAITELTDEEIVREAWHEDATLSFEILDEKIFDETKRHLTPEGKRIRRKSFSRCLTHLEKAGAAITVSIKISLEKAKFIEVLNLPESLRCVIFVSSNKFIQAIRNKKYTELNQLFTPKSESAIILLLANATGFARGPNLSIFGLDHWRLIDFDEIDVTVGEKTKNTIQFRENECQWEIGEFSLTPFHLHIETAQLQPDNVIPTLAKHRDLLCLGYLANRMHTRDKSIVCDFFGHKHVQVILNQSGSTPSSMALYNLFSWTYEDFSSDKIGILRQIISLQLTEKPDFNYKLLVDSAESILRSAKSNFQFFLRRSVELYFDKRLKVSEFLHKFSDELGKSISAMASELINNLYKTVGIVLGVIIAALLDPPKTPVIVHWTSLLYFIYIVFILLLLLPSYYLRFRGNVLEYEHSKMELKDVLLVEEIERIEGKTFKRSRREFLIAFFLVNLAYTVFAGMAFMLFSLS